MLVFNPLTGRCKELPPLNHPRKPVIMHMILSNYMRTNSGPSMSTSDQRNLIRQIKSNDFWRVHHTHHLQNASVPFGEEKLCMLNTETRLGHICDMESGFKLTRYKLCSPTWNTDGEMNFHSYKPVTFSFQPSFMDFNLEHTVAERSE